MINSLWGFVKEKRLVGVLHACQTFVKKNPGIGIILRQERLELSDVAERLTGWVFEMARVGIGSPAHGQNSPCQADRKMFVRLLVEMIG
jgi:hypothetical protein